MSQQDLSAVSPALARYEREVLLDGVWTRPGLSPRDRGLVTLAALIARGQPAPLPSCIDRALDVGVTAREVSEIVTHLAFYAGWGSCVTAAPLVAAAFAGRGITIDDLPSASPTPLPIDQAAEDRRASAVEQSVGSVSRSLADDTAAVLFRDLWLRPDLAPRDRSMVTVAALIAGGQFPQITFHLGKAMDNGLSPDEASELLSHLAYYAGWPNAMSAVPVFKSVFESRAKP
jgi:4-carboxymuconolactone decarboxylase